MKNIQHNTAILAVVIAVLFAVGGFFAGTHVQKLRTGRTLIMGGNFQRGQEIGQRFDGQARGGNQASMVGYKPTSGEVISVDASSVTVKLVDGSTKVILLSDNTQVNKTDEATREDIKTGETITVFGTINTDGSVVAQNIQLNAGRMGIQIRN